MVEVRWEGKMAFRAEGPSGQDFVMDSVPEHGGEGKGPTPVEVLLGSVATCSAMDVISILRKKQQTVLDYRLEVASVKSTNEDFPRPIEKITVKHILSGPNLDPIAVARAIQLSDEKYCTVQATLRNSPKIETTWLIEEPVAL